VLVVLGFLKFSTKKWWYGRFIDEVASIDRSILIYHISQNIIFKCYVILSKLCKQYFTKLLNLFVTLSYFSNKF
jgi:hypothetical protein